MTTWVFPGQGSQARGMGETLFDRYADLTAQADALLGYSLRELCLEDLGIRLNQTLYTQPALYVVNALSYLAALEETGGRHVNVPCAELNVLELPTSTGERDHRRRITCHRGRCDIQVA